MVDNLDVLDKMVNQYRKELFDQTAIVQFKFLYLDDESWGKNETSKNRKRLTTLLEGGRNIYVIWTRSLDQDTWSPRYVGERMCSDCRERIRNHLFIKPDGTNSKLKQVKEAVREGKLIGVTAILVDPDQMRTFVEQRLIEIVGCNGLRLDWNIHHNRRLDRYDGN